MDVGFTRSVKSVSKPQANDWSVSQQRAVRACLLQAREQVAATQAAVAKSANISLRTYATLESPKRTHRPRPEILVRVAFSLGIDPQRIIETSGHATIHTSLIRQIGLGVRRPTRRELDPHDFFDSIKDRISEKSPVLFCVAYSAPPGSAHRADVKSVLIDLIDRGLWIALCVPYPRVEAETTGKPNLVNYYKHVYGQVIATAFDLAGGTARSKRKQIGVFVPTLKDPSGAALFATPPISATETRSALIKWCDAPSPEAQYELGAWVTFAHDMSDRWYTVFSRRHDQHIGGDSLSVLPAWKDYFRDIISGCDPISGRSWQTENGMWQKVDITAA